MASNNLILADEEFGPILSLIKDDLITDINYNGKSLWVDHVKKGRYEVKDIEITEDWVTQFTQKLSNLMNLQCNRSQPYLEAETDELRISILHEAITNTGYSISIRKTPPVRRINYEKMLKEEYCTKAIEAFLSNCVKAGMNIVVCGLPGTGKTELVKYLTKFIPPYEKTITIEDNLEIRYRSINPEKDCVEIKVRNGFDYDTAIKLSMRQLPTWILIAETRGKEVTELLKSMSTGTHCMTTLHTDSVRKVPERIKNMSNDVNESDIYMFLDVAVQVKSIIQPGIGIKRFISEIAIINHDVNTGKNEIIMLYDGQNLEYEKVPKDMLIRFSNRNIDDPFKKTYAPYELEENIKENIKEKSKNEEIKDENNNINESEEKTENHKEIKEKDETMDNEKSELGSDFEKEKENNKEQIEHLDFSNTDDLNRPEYKDIKPKKKHLFRF